MTPEVAQEEVLQKGVLVFMAVDVLPDGLRESSVDDWPIWLDKPEEAMGFGLKESNEELGAGPETPAKDANDSAGWNRDRKRANNVK